MVWLGIAASLSLIGIGAVVWFAMRVDPLSGRVGRRSRTRPAHFPDEGAHESVAVRPPG